MSLGELTISRQTQMVQQDVVSFDPVQIAKIQRLRDDTRELSEALQAKSEELSEMAETLEEAASQFSEAADYLGYGLEQLRNLRRA
jgi:trans-2-enoyl-CoA reductase